MAPGPWGRLVENISGRLAFFPPRPPTYKVEEHNDNTGELYIQPLDSDIPRVTQCTVERIATSSTRKGNHGGGSNVVTAYVPYKSRGTGQSAKVTLLYSHGNAVDLGQMLPVYRELAKLLKVNVMGYDYTGYGASDGDNPTIGHTFSDVSSVYQHLTDSMGLAPASIILYGQSVGSGPTSYLAAQESEVGGVVLHSPLLSGVRVLSPGIKWWPSFADVYPNHLMVPKIKAPTFIMHGTEDEVIDITCGKRLHDLCKHAVEPLWAEGFNHQNLEMSTEYLPRLRDFISVVESKLDAQASS